MPDIPGMFTTFKARNVPLFVDGEQFYSHRHYGKIMGYDKPLSLKWKDHGIEQEKTSESRLGEEQRK